MGFLTIPLILMVVGMVIGVGGFLFAAINMATAVNMTGNIRSATTEFGRFGRMFKRHWAAIVVMAIGGLLVLIGLISVAYLTLAALFAPYGF